MFVYNPSCPVAPIGPIGPVAPIGPIGPVAPVVPVLLDIKKSGFKLIIQTPVAPKVLLK